MLTDKVIEMIDQYKMLQDGDGVVVGFSGGPDSVCLLHILHSLRQKYNIKLYAVHLNHMIRGQEAMRDEEFARSFSEKLHIPFFSEQIEVEVYAGENGLSSEEAGRKLRYELFHKIKVETGAAKIALAHNRNDQTETVIMRFLRGTGISGLGGIRPVRDEAYIRPILNCSRAEIETYCEYHQLNPVIDSTNATSVYTRNRIRLEIIPYIKKYFNPNIDESIFKTSNIMRDEDDYLDMASEQALKNIMGVKGVDGKNFNQLHIAVKRRIIRLLIEKTKGNLIGIESKHVEDCILFINTMTTGKSISLPDNIRCRIEYESFCIYQSLFEEEAEDYDFKLKIPGETIVNGNRKVITKIYELNNKNLIDKQFVKYFDYDKIKYGLSFRNRRDGDYMYPKGMTGSKKLKEIFIDRKVPREIRNTVALIACQNEILWILQMRDSRNFKVDEKTKHILEISIEGGSLNE